MAAAVAAWSPVIIFTAMPAAWQVGDGLDHLLARRVDQPDQPEQPKVVVERGVDRLRRRPGRSATASTRSPSAAYRSSTACAAAATRRVDVAEQDLRGALQVATAGRPSSDAGALAMYWRAESKGSTAPRAGGGRTARRGRSRPARPRPAAPRRSGRRSTLRRVPVAVELRLVGQRARRQQPAQRAVAAVTGRRITMRARRGVPDALDSASSPRGVQARRSTISLRVSVPVLSVQITVVEPSVSTAGSSRTTARRARHPLHADGERDGDDRGQALGDRGHRQRDGGQGGVGERVAAQQRHAEQHHRDHADDLGDASTRAGRCCRVSGVCVGSTLPSRPEMRPSSVRVAGRHHDGLGRAGGDERAAVQQRPALGEFRGGVDRVGGLVHRHGLAGQRRLVRAQPARLQDPQVRDDPRPGLERHHVPGHQGLRAGLRPPPVAPHRRRLGHELRQRLDRLAGAVLLRRSR